MSHTSKKFYEPFVNYISDDDRKRLVEIFVKDKRIDEDLSVSKPDDWVDKTISMPIMPIPADDNTAGAIKPMSNQKSNGITMPFDVSIGSTAIRKTFIVNSRNESILLAGNCEPIMEAIEAFDMRIKISFDHMLPKFVIKSGDNEVNYRDSKMLFYGLSLFENTKITASFIHFVEMDDEIFPDGKYNVFNAIQRTCSFFILGECELDETESKILGMTIESLNYDNPHRNITECLYK
jgi:hypothetical protein